MMRANPNRATGRQEARRFRALAPTILWTVVLLGVHTPSRAVTGTFIESGTAPTPNLVRLTCRGAGEIIAVDVALSGPTTSSDIYSFAFSVDIGDPSIVAWVGGYGPGQVLTPIGDQNEPVTVIALHDNHVVVAQTKLAGVSGTGPGNGVGAVEAPIVTLLFRVLQAGTSSLAFAAYPSNVPSAIDSAGSPIASIQFDAATARICSLLGAEGCSATCTAEECPTPSRISTLNADSSYIGRRIIEATVSHQMPENGRLRGNVQIENRLRMWLGTDPISGCLATSTCDFVADDEAGSAGFFAARGLLPACERGLGCQDPGRAAWIASFCSAGTITIRVHPTAQSAFTNTLDLILGQLGVDATTLVDLVADLEHVPGFAQVRGCFTSGVDAREQYRCATRTLRDLSQDHRQLEQVLQILRDAGIDLTLDRLIQRLLSFPLDVISVLADTATFFHVTDGTGQLDLEIIAE